MLVRPLHPQNALAPMLVNSLPSSKIILARFVHSLNAFSPILVTFFGIPILLSSAHPENALFPITVTLSGIVMFVRPVQL